MACRRFDGVKWVEKGQFDGGVNNENRVDYLDDGEWRTQSRFGWETREKKRAHGIPCQVPDPKEWRLGDDLRVVNEAGPPWVVHDRDMGRLMILSHGPEFADVRLAPLSVEDGALPLSVDDAISWSREEVLIATRKGLKLYNVATGKLRPAAEAGGPPGPSARPRRVGPDLDGGRRALDGRPGRPTARPFLGADGRAIGGRNPFGGPGAAGWGDRLTRDLEG